MMSMDNKKVKTDKEKVQEPKLNTHEDSEDTQYDRNKLERKRRNRFNILFDQLAACIADRCTTKKSTQKSQILRHTIEYFREQEILAAEKAAHEPFGSVKPAFITDDEFSLAFLESMLAFIFAMDERGNVIYVSDNVHASVGHFPDHILQRSVFEFIHAKDHLVFQLLLLALSSDSNPTLTVSPSGGKGRTRLAQRFEPFSCHFCRGSGSGFEAIHCVGTIIKTLPNRNLESSKCLLVIAKPLNRVPLNTTLLRSDGPQTEFSARLNMEAKYDYLDKRVASVLGYFPSELTGNSLFEYCHFEDLDVLVEYHKILLLTGTITTCYYRHLTKGQSWIWLQSRYHLSYSDWTSKPQAVTCLSWVVPYTEVTEKQGEILTRDREKFVHIRADHNSADGMSTSSNSSFNLSAATSQDLTSKNTAKKVNYESRIKPHSFHTESLSSLGCSPEPEDSQIDNSGASLTPAYDSDLMENELIEFERFLQRLNLPVNLSNIQQDLHRFLSEKYTQLINTISKQNEQLGALQKQIKVQGELRELIERLEEVKSKKDSEKEYTISKEVLDKFEEIRRVCAGTRPEKSTTQRLATCSSRLQENRSQEQRIPVILPEQMAENGVEQQQNYSIMDCSHIKAEQSPLPQRQPDIFFNQENWLETQLQQVQLQRQKALMKQMRNTHYIPQEQPMMMLHGEQQRQQQRQQQMTQQFQQEQLMTMLHGEQQQQMTQQFQQKQMMPILHGEQQQHMTQQFQQEQLMTMLHEEQQQQMTQQFQQKQLMPILYGEQQQQMAQQFQQEQLMMMLHGEQQEQMTQQFQQKQLMPILHREQQQQMTQQFQQEQLMMLLHGEQQQQQQMTQQSHRQQQMAQQFHQQQQPMARQFNWSN